jgi:hypothetical protein
MAAWLITTGSGMDDWIYWHRLVQPLLITINYNSSNKWLPKTRSILVLVLSQFSFSFSLNSDLSRVESNVTTDGQSAGLSWNKAPIWGLRPDFYYCQTVAGLLIWHVISDERAGLSFTIAAGPCQRSHSRVRVSRRTHRKHIRFQTMDICEPHRKHFFCCQKCVFIGPLPSSGSTCHIMLLQLVD